MARSTRFTVGYHEGSRWLPLVTLAVVILTSLVRPAAAQTYYPPIDAYVDTSTLPQDMVEAGEGESGILDRIKVKEFLYSEVQNAAGKDIGATVTGKLVFEGGFRLRIPGLDAFEIVIGAGEFSFEAKAREEISPIAEENFPFQFRIASLPLALRMKSDLLKPIKKTSDGKWEEYARNPDGLYLGDDGQPIYPELINTVDVILRYTWDGESSIEFADTGGGTAAQFSFSTPIMVGDSGIVLEVQNAQVDLSDTQSPAGVTDPTWRGVKFDQFAVHFSGALELPELGEGQATPTRPELADIQLTNFAVGNGGFSGKISGAASGLIKVPLGGMDFELAGIDLEFQQNALTSSGITGIVRDFPFFEKDIKLELALDMSGNFKIGVAADDANRNVEGLVAWEIQSVLTLEVQSIAFELREEVFYTRLNGAVLLDFLDSEPGVKPEEDSSARVPINGLTIGSDGRVSLEGGWVTLPEKRYLNFNAFRVELAQIGFGSEDSSPDQKWMGFSGGVELVKGLSASAKFKKLQFLWPKKNGGAGVDTRLQGVEVGFSKPKVVSFKGSVDWFEDADKKGFAGSILANLEFIKTSVNGRLVIGQTLANTGAPATSVGNCSTPNSNDPFKFFFLDLEANLPSGIPVFSDVSIYGFMGLFSVNMEPHICAFQTPLDWFKTHLTATNVVAGQPPPWVPRDSAVAVGLGVILGTTHDDGYVINTKVALTVAVPGPLVMLSGAGNIIKSRGELTGSADPIFMALAIYDGRQSTFLINLGVFYKVPDDGAVFDISAQTEAFFNLSDPNDWHLWLGKRTPEEERIRATVLKFLSASAYYMLDPGELGFGAKAGFDSRPKWKFGPLRVELAAWVGYDIAIAWRPVHAWGAAELGGHAKLKAFGFGIGLSAHAGLEVETPTPFVIDGRFKVKLSLPWPLPDPKATVHLRWEKQRPKPPLDQLVTQISLEASKTTASVDARIERSTIVAGGHSIDQNTLCSPWESLPIIPELDEDLNGNGSLDPGEDFNGDGQLNVSVPESSCTARPMVPVTYRPVIAFGRNTNERLAGADQPTLVGNAGNYFDVVGKNERFEYNLKSLRFWATKKTTANNVTFPAGSVLPKVYGAWPALVGDPEQPAAIYVKLWSKNPFSIYDANTYLFYNDNTESWPEWFAATYGDYPCPPGKIIILNGDPRMMKDPRECADPTILEEEDLILPPYHIFALAVESEEAGTGKEYKDVAYFHTEGVPLSLDPFVYNTVPGSLDALHYRSYDVGLRGNETYLDLLYKEPGSPIELVYKDPQQKLAIEIVDESGEPLRDPDGNLVTITTSWEQAPDHISTRNDQKWLDLIQDRGVPVNTGLRPTDDMIYARPNWPGGLRPSERYSVRVWFEDKRLGDDARLFDPIWLKANKVRRIDADNDRVLLYEFPFVTSAYNSFAELGATYEGKWWPLTLGAFNSAIVNPAVSKAITRSNPPPTTGNASAEAIARFLAQASSLNPSDLVPGTLEKWLWRVPGYTDNPDDLTETERAAIIEAWKDDLGAFEVLDKHFLLDRMREPLPLQVELNVLQFGSNSNSKAFLLEFPEPVEWARVKLQLSRRADSGSPWSSRRSALVISRDGTRAFIFDVSSGLPASLADMQYRLHLTFDRDLGGRNPLLKAPSPASSEFSELIAELPGGHFEVERP